MADTKSKSSVFSKVITIAIVLGAIVIFAFCFLVLYGDSIKDFSFGLRVKERVYTFEEYDESFFPGRESDGALVVKVSKNKVDLTDLKGSGVEGVYEGDKVRYMSYAEDTGCHIEDYIVRTDDGMRISIYVEHGCEYVELSIYDADNNLIYEVDEDL